VKTRFLFTALLAAILTLAGCTSYGPSPAGQEQITTLNPAAAQRPALPPGEPFRFTVAADNRPGFLNRRGFQWAISEMNRLIGNEGAFLIMAGDFDPPHVTDHDFRTQFGADMVWYPVVGNHEAETPADMEWVRDRFKYLPYIVRQGPPGSETTTYSFDYGSAHFVVLNQYYTGGNDHSGKGNVCDPLYEWLKADLNATKQPFIFVIGHEPAYPGGRHVGDSLDLYPANRDRFWKLLNERGVAAYFCGHTHSYARYQKGGNWPTTTWQVDIGNLGQGSPQTFVDVVVAADKVRFSVYGGTPGKAFTVHDAWTVQIDHR